jgi:PAS domain S-box-containing protein
MRVPKKGVHRPLESDEIRVDDIRAPFRKRHRLARDHFARLHSEVMAGRGRAGASPTRPADILSVPGEPYRSIVEAIPAITYTDTCMGSTSSPLFVSPQVESSLGFTREEWLADPDFRWRHAHPDDRHRVAQMDLAAREGAQPFEAEYRLITKDGREVWLQDRAMPVRDDRTQAVTVHGVVFDVTRRHTAMAGPLTDISENRRFEAILRESEQQFRKLFEASPDAIVLIDPHDPDGSWPILDCNEAACKMNGYSREELTGESIDILNISRGTLEERATYLSRLRRDSVISLETFHRHKDGHVFPVEVSTSLVTFGGRELVLGIDRDITERKRTEQALHRALESERESAERLRELDEMKNAFLTAVSHDLRTPLTALLGSALTLERLRSTLSAEDQDHLVHAISFNAERLQRMLSDLLDLDRLTRGVLEPVRTRTDMAALITHLIEDSGVLEDHRVHVETDQLFVDVDRPKVERILDNLLANARRHTDPGTEIWIAVEPVDGGILLIVEDAGPGVPEASREQIFEPFKQLGEPSPHSPGVGIGLALVAKFAELHGGRAWVQEREGGGASFRVFLSATTSQG